VAWLCFNWDLIVCLDSEEKADISFQNDECLALSVDSTNPDAADCYHIVSERTHFRLERAQQIAAGQRGTSNLAVCISQHYDAVALLNRDGTHPHKLI
jgi:hypothetical protein